MAKGRDKLKQLGIDLPVLPTTTVGSFPKPPELQQARADFAKKKISRGDLDVMEEKATRFWIETQERLGIDILVDGEMYRGDMVAYFAENWGGFEIGGLVRSYGNRYYHKPIVTGPIAWRGPLTVGWWKKSQAMTQRPVKGMLTGPYTIMDWSFNEYYPDRRATCLALAREVRKEVEALVQAGCKIIQVDEPALSVRPGELELACEAMGVVTRDLPAYFVTHICYGSFEEIYPGMLKMPVDNFDLEMSNSDLAFLEAFRKDAFTADLSMGVLDVHSHRVEPGEQVSDRIRRTLDVVPHANVWIDPDCGLKTRSVEEAVAKLEIMSQATAVLRRTL
jgi:5-methyltetrahydropteroyltriglutamate--homocysteine methyltransferase